jgi:hypothetical protein
MTDLHDKFQEIHKENDEDCLQSGEGIESIVCKNLYDHIFNVPLESERNHQI